MVGQKTAINGMLTVGARLLSRLIDLVTLVVLARLLEPRYFGIVAIATGIVSMLEAALDLPVGSALIPLQTVRRAHLDTAFTISLLRGAVLSTILVAAAWPVAAFYGDGRLALLICFISISPFSRGMLSPKLVQYQRGLSFWRDLLIEAAGKSTSSALAIGTGFAFHSYWAIAIGTVAFPLTATIGSYIVAPYRPRLTLQEVRYFSGFVSWLSLAQIFSAVNWQVERLLLGKVMPPSKVGLFTTASDLASVACLAFLGPLIRPLLAAFSHLNGDMRAIRQTYTSAASGVLAFGLPILVGQCILAEPMVRLALGSKWLAAVPLVKLLALSLIPAILAMPAVPLFVSFERPMLVFKRNALELAIKLPVAVLGVIYFGYWGAIAARLLSETIAGAYSMRQVSKLTGLTIAKQLLSSSRYIASTLLMTFPVVETARIMMAATDDPMTVLLAATLVGVGCYAASLSALWLLLGRPPGPEAMAFRILAPAASRAPAWFRAYLRSS